MGEPLDSRGLILLKDLVELRLLLASEAEVPCFDLIFGLCDRVKMLERQIKLHKQFEAGHDPWAFHGIDDRDDQEEEYER